MNVAKIAPFIDNWIRRGWVASDEITDWELDWAKRQLMLLTASVDQAIATRQKRRERETDVR